MSEATAELAPEQAFPTLRERSVPGRRAVALPELPADAPTPEATLPPELLRRSPLGLPELSELGVVRHFTALSKKNFSIDEQLYPLGSCTMKYNPRLNEHVAGLPGFRDLHPYQPLGQLQGALQVWHELEEMLRAICGLDAIAMQPAAGAHGELAGLLAIRAYHQARGEGDQRVEVLIPKSAHGTNPASVAIAGMRAVTLETDAEGRTSLEDLERKITKKTATLMLTNPSTLGLFETAVQEIADRLHAEGALLYMDGANLNALLGVARPGDFGVDCMHLNLHKTFSTPHGGGGPGSGPIAVTSALEPFLPGPRVTRLEDGTYALLESGPLSIGRVKAFYGHMGMVFRAYAYLRAHSWRDLRGIAEHAVLNANYLLARLKDAYELPYDGPCMHEVVFSAQGLKKRHGVSALDVAKALLDYGFHAPTIYFPLIVGEALMIEPTETEAKETLDRFVDAMLEIARVAETAPERLHQAPTTLPVQRLDEVKAARHLCCRF